VSSAGPDGPAPPPDQGAPPRIFLLSPASCSGGRAQVLCRDEAAFDLALRVRSHEGAPLGEVFSFLSGLYFRGKLTYAQAFARPPAGLHGVLVITPASGLRPPGEHVGLRHLRRWAGIDVSLTEPRYLRPLRRDLRALAEALGEGGEVVLLGSIATDKYVAPLSSLLGARLRFPSDFVGRGDMSRGGLLLRRAADGQELPYAAPGDVARHGAPPPRLQRRPGLLKAAFRRS
jgi:hypothetical protein